MMGDPYNLLGRAERKIDFAQTVAPLAGHRIMVTGAAGTIGSALCAILHDVHMGEVIAIDRDESRLFQLSERLPTPTGRGARMRFVLADVANAAWIDEIVHETQPNLVIHAAAYKHVPMLERHEQAAQLNNVEGTRNVLAALRRAGHASRFVLVSTDKAVDPASVMGRTKRHAEMIVLGDDDSTVVRFGNVLGSSNSVVDIWLRHIESGGAIVVTDPGMERYFMTLREAAHLVLSAASDDAAVGGICVADMGAAVRLGDLAERFMKACGGYVVISEPRPGEKRAERLTADDEFVLRERDHYAIFVRRRQGVPL